MQASQSNDGYDIPDEFENLDEVTGPPPVENRNEQRIYRHESLEDERGDKHGDNRRYSHLATARDRRDNFHTTKSPGTRPEQNLTEVTAPPPVQDTDEETTYQTEEHLESPQTSDSGVPSPPSSLDKDQPLDQNHLGGRASKFATQLYTVSYLIFFSILGTLARLGVQWLTFYPGAPLVTSVLWANVGGSLFMGFLAEDRRLFREGWTTSPKHTGSNPNLVDEEKGGEDAAKENHAKVKKTIPLYIGLATGFCGSFTSFSSFQRDVFLALSNDLPASIYHPSENADGTTFSKTMHREGGYSFMALLAVIIYTSALSVAALKVGAHLALASEFITPTVPFKFTRRVLDRAMVFLGWGCWLGAIFLAIWPPDRASEDDGSSEVWRGAVLFALVFAPVGCLARFWISLRLNSIAASFPLGTFVVNIFGCMIEAMCYDLQRVPLLGSANTLPGGGRIGCQVLEGISDGFCGCLTTVSTWVTELQGLRRQHAYLYGFATLGVGLSVMVAIMGSVRWTKGWTEPFCVVTRTSI
ncbi:hypothetical protein M8818_002446 [Zalaria obscura]|uniref:Uncharacterized protein n=1 Tax=Zalaria obscura TaxID=2024903 RepID=A0ACC3SJT8_9PEZI